MIDEWIISTLAGCRAQNHLAVVSVDRLELMKRLNELAWFKQQEKRKVLSGDDCPKCGARRSMSKAKNMCLSCLGEF